MSFVKNNINRQKATSSDGRICHNEASFDQEVKENLLNQYYSFDYHENCIVTFGGEITNDNLFQSENLNQDEKFIDQGYRRNPIPFTVDTGIYIQNLISSHIRSGNGNFKTWIVPEKDPCLRYEIKRFAVAVECYINTEGSIQSLKELLDGLLDPNYALFLKRYRAKSFLESASCRIIDEDAEYTNLPYSTIKDIGDIFNYNYWFNWLIETDDKDYELGLERVKPYTYDLEEEFKDALWDLLPDDLEEIDEREILIKVSGASSLEGIHWKEKSKSNKFEKSGLIGRRVIVQTGPATQRDTVVLSPNHINSIQLIEQQCALICEQMSSTVYWRDFQLIKKEIEQLTKYPYISYYDRDIEKEGITKPRELIKLCGEVFKQKWPGYKAWDLFSIYSSYSLIVDGVGLIKMERGHGLGMANSLTSIIQSTIHKIVMDRLYSRNLVIGEIRNINYNDDSTTAFTKESDMDDYIDVDSEVCKDFGIKDKKKKSHRGKRFVFCEQYMDFNKKLSSRNFLKNLGFTASNITEAKSMFSGTWSDLGISTLGELVSFWGYEFYPNEHLHTRLFGGWVAKKFSGLNTEFHHEYPIMTYDSLRAFTVINKVPRIEIPRKKGKKIYNSPLDQLFGHNLNLDGRDSDLRYRITESEMHVKFDKVKNCREYETLTTNFLDKRRRMFHGLKIHGDKERILQTYYNDIMSQERGIDFIPPWKWCKISKIDPIEKEPFVPFKNPNPTLGFVKYHNPKLFAKGDKIIPDPISLFRKDVKPLTEQDISNNTEICRLFKEEISLFITYRGKYDVSRFTQYWNDPDTVYALYSIWESEYDKIPYLTERVDRKGSEFWGILSNPNLKKFACYIVKILGVERTIEICKEEDFLSDLFTIPDDIRPIKEPKPSPEINEHDYQGLIDDLIEETREMREKLFAQEIVEEHQSYVLALDDAEAKSLFWRAMCNQEKWEVVDRMIPTASSVAALISIRKMDCHTGGNIKKKVFETQLSGIQQHILKILGFVVEPQPSGLYTIDDPPEESDDDNDLGDFF